MGLNAYFTYQVVGVHGTGLVPYRTALTAVFAEGFIFILLSLVGLRQYIVRLVPESIKIASGVGIGLFLTEIGLSYSGGIGLITGSNSQPLRIGGCPPQYRNKDTGVCDAQLMRNPQVRTHSRIVPVKLIPSSSCGLGSYLEASSRHT